MRADFDKMPDDSRLWIYQATRKLTQKELEAISERLVTFTNQWAAHGQPLKSSSKIVYDQFVILAVDESFNGASGCSIDGSTRIVKELEGLLGMQLLDRTLIAFYIGNEVVTIKLNDLGGELSKGTWGKDTLTFNNLVPTKADLEKNWIVPASETWLRKYLTKVTAF